MIRGLHLEPWVGVGRDLLCTLLLTTLQGACSKVEEEEEEVFITSGNWRGKHALSNLHYVISCSLTPYDIMCARLRSH